MTATSYRSSPIKRKRRSRAQMDTIRKAICEVLAAEHPMTARQVFYQLVGRGVVDKTEPAYKGTVLRLLKEMRLAGIHAQDLPSAILTAAILEQHPDPFSVALDAILNEAVTIPFDWIADNSRWMRKPQSHDSVEDMLAATQSAYRRNLWSDQDAYVEIWIEKDALAGLVYHTTSEWNVPLMVTRGYPSLSFLWEAAQAFPVDKDVYVYYFGDYDPTGLDIARNIEERLGEFGASVEFERVAVTLRQINEWKLPVRPTKRTDSRTKKFGEGGSVELDTLSTQQLQDLVEDCIIRHIDFNTWDRTQTVAAEERKSLKNFLEK